MRQTITETYKNSDGQPVVIVSGGNCKSLTKDNLKKCQQIFADKADFETPRHHATGLLYSGKYATTIFVRGDNWDSIEALFAKEI